MGTETVLPLPIDTFLPYMRDVVRCEQSLQELNQMWRMIEASAKMNCPVEAKTILPTMAATRAGFNQLEEELVNSLVQEKVGNVLTELGTKAQYVIEIVVRNLFERTADVGFLATDRELCRFVAGQDSDAGAIRMRLRAYRSKYTVYAEIMLLDLAGNVLVQIDEDSPVEGSVDPLIAATLASDTYVETFRASDLRPGKRQTLIYSRRMHHPDSGAVIGVLCLCFAFSEEMARIFQSHRDPKQRANMLLLDVDDRVIASADPGWIPLGTKVPVNRGGSSALMMLAGREYLVRTFASPGYQGYPGPAGWQGQVMIPVDVAFGSSGSNVLRGLDPRVAEGLLSHARSFCPPLHEIVSAAGTIRRVVWNGQVMTAGQDGDLLKLKTILEQISETGARSNALFSHSIRNLYETVLESGLSDSEFVSHLLVDLLDRNLYERADDCRWWALTPELGSILAQGAQTENSLARIDAILHAINALYTVYTRIFVYDHEGRIIAGTHAQQDAESVIGSHIDQATLCAVHALRGEQDYHVSPFEISSLYGERPTYIYHAAIRHPQNPGQIIGGVGIVFDAEPEFRAMLQHGLGEKENAQAFFIERSGRIISSTDVHHPIDSMLTIDPALLALANGACASQIITYDGHYAIMGCTVSSGYREFKVSDGYRADVIAVVINNFGAVRERPGAGEHAATLLENDLLSQEGTEFATFFIDDGLFAVTADSVQKAMPASEISPVSMGGSNERVGILALEHDQYKNAEDFVWVFDLGYLLSGVSTVVNANSQVVIIKNGRRSLGLLVSELHGVAKFSHTQLIATPLASSPGGMLVKQVIKANRGSLLIQAIDVEYLFGILTEPQQPLEISLAA